MAHGKDSKFRIGLAQFACSLDPDENLRKASKPFAKRPERARRSSASRSSSGLNTSAGKRTPDLFDLAESIPGPSTDAIGKVARRVRRRGRRLSV